MKQIPITLAETAHWHAMLGRAEYLVQECLPADVSDYLVKLFLRLEQDFGSEHELLMPASRSGDSKESKLQRLGDKCLLLCGFYPDITREYDVQLEEFVTMGRDAYRTRAHSAEHDEVGVFNYLGSHFEQVVDMLSRIHQLSDSTIKATNQSGLIPTLKRDRAMQPIGMSITPMSRNLN